MIKHLPIEENPREKAFSKGIESLSNIELLALILRTGNKEESVLQLAQRLLYEIGGFDQLQHVDYSTLISLKGIKQAKAIEILSVIEMSKRLKSIQSTHCSLLTPYDIYLTVKDELMFLKQEHFLILCLDTRNCLIKKKTLFIGSLNMSVVTPREVFKEAVSVSSARIVLCHNHPSGDSEPSQEDVFLTNQFIELGKMMGIDVIDHIVIGWNEYYSIIAKKKFKDKHD